MSPEFLEMQEGNLEQFKKHEKIISELLDLFNNLNFRLNCLEADMSALKLKGGPSITTKRFPDLEQH